MREGDGAEECPALGLPCVSLSTSPRLISLIVLKEPGSCSRTTLLLLSQHSPCSPFLSPKLSLLIWGEAKAVREGFQCCFPPEQQQRTSVLP